MFSVSVRGISVEYGYSTPGNLFFLFFFCVWYIGFLPLLFLIDTVCVIIIAHSDNHIWHYHGRTPASHLLRNNP